MDIGQPLKRHTIIPLREKVAPTREPQPQPLPERRPVPVPQPAV